MLKHLGHVTVLLAAVVLVGCGEGSGSAGSDLTPEQKNFVDQTQDRFSKLKADSQKLIDQLKQKAESKEAEQAVAALETALADAQKVVTALRSADGQTFDKKKAAVEPVLKDLAAKYAAAAKTKLGGIKLPSL